MPGKISPTLRSGRTKLSAKLLTTVQYTPPPSSQQTRFISETILRSLMPAAHPPFNVQTPSEEGSELPPCFSTKGSPKVSCVAFTWLRGKSASTSISVKIFGYPVDETGTSHSITGFDELSFCFLTLSGDENR